MLSQIQSLIALVLIALAATGLGGFFLRSLRLDIRDRFAHSVFSVTIGLVLAGTFLALLGLVGLLYAPLIGILTLVAAFWTVGTALQTREFPNKDIDEETDEDESSVATMPNSFLWFAAFVSLVACLAALVGAAAPTTAGDALCYHLELPKAFLADHRLAFYPYSENSTFPLLVEMWFLWALAIDGPVSAGLVHWLLGLVFAGATVVLADAIVGRRWACLAGCVALLVPGVTNQMTAPMNDLGLALTTTVALAAWWRAVMLEEGRPWLIVAGIAAGGALATKYLALIFALAMAAGCLWVARQKGHRRQLVLESVAVIAVVAASTAGLWYVRAAWHRGNPVYPFLTEVFVPEGPVYADAHETLPESKSRLGRTLWGPLTAAWHVTMAPEQLGGRSHQPGVLFLAILPGLLLVRRLRGLGTLLIIAAAYWIVWYLLRQNVRFLLPIIPIASIAVVWVVAEMARFPAMARWAGTALVCAILLAYATVAVARSRDQLAVAAGLQSRESYLNEVEPTWEAAAASNASFGQQGHLLSLDYRAYYFDCPVTREKVYRRHTGYHLEVERPEQLAQFLLAAGFTHLLLAENLNEDGAQFDRTLPQLVADSRAARGSQAFPILWEYTFDDIDGGRRQYQLVLVH